MSERAGRVEAGLRVRLGWLAYSWQSELNDDGWIGHVWWSFVELAASDRFGECFFLSGVSWRFRLLTRVTDSGDAAQREVQSHAPGPLPLSQLSWREPNRPRRRLRVLRPLAFT